MDQCVMTYELFRGCSDFGFRDQICRAALSMPSNIAEGMERNSVKETIQFLHIAKGSCAEVRTQGLVAVRVGYLGNDASKSYLEELISISKMLTGLIRSLKNNA